MSIVDEVQCFTCGSECSGSLGRYSSTACLVAGAGGVPHAQTENLADQYGHWAA